MCEQSYWNPLEDPPCQSPLDDPLRKGANTKTYTLARKARVYSGEKYGTGVPTRRLGREGNLGPGGASAGGAGLELSVPGREDPLEGAGQPMPVFLLENPRTHEPGGLQSTGSQSGGRA